MTSTSKTPPARMREYRCTGCQRLLFRAMFAQPVSLETVCPRCKAVYTLEAEPPIVKPKPAKSAAAIDKAA